MFLQRVSAIIISLLVCTQAKAACDLPVKTPLSVVSLFKREFLSRLENANNLANLCHAYDAACIKSALSPQTETLPVYDRPSGQPIAFLSIVYDPGHGLSATVLLKDKSFIFTPTFFDQDWGYGPPWFHATLLDQQGAWKQIALPGVKSGWIFRPEAEVFYLPNPTSGRQLYNLGERSLVILAVSPTSLTFRDAQPSDLSCQEDDAVAPSPQFTSKTLPFIDVYDSACSLRLVPTYPRGC